MKFKQIVLSIAAVGILFVGCNDSKKKEAEAQAQAEELRMEREADSILKLEEEKMARMEDMEANSISAKAMGNDNLSTLVSALQTAN